ncbi:hypothetical protein [Candidatus Coxiella mudrowiae]|nr:hypothetical protein [Candidatus Coxiella mudrowiae]
METKQIKVNIADAGVHVIREGIF